MTSLAGRKFKKYDNRVIMGSLELINVSQPIQILAKVSQQ
jgi:hypothetical protein